MTVLQEPVQAAVWHALNHYAYRDAVFLAERLYAEVHSEEALFLLATCYYRSGKAYKAYRLLKGHSCTTPQCKYLLAKCCVELSKLAEGEQILTGGVLNKQKSQEDIVTEFGDSACFTLSMLGQIYCKTDRLAKGSECYQKSLSMNPFLWSPFESLCQIGDRPDPEQIFRLTSLQCFSGGSGAPSLLPISPAHTPSHNMPHRQVDTVLMETPQDTLELNRLNLESSNSKYSSLNTDSTMSYIDSSSSPPDTVGSLGTGGSLLSKQVQNKPKSGRSLLGGPAALSPLTPSFGILPLEPSPGEPLYLQNYSHSGSGMEPPPPGVPPKKSVARISQVGTKSVFAQSGNSREVIPIPFNQTQTTAPPQTSTTPQVLSPTIAAPPNVQPRRSSRLFTSASSTAKENSKKLKMKFPTKIPNRKTKSKTGKGGITPSNLNESIEILKLDSSMTEGKVSMGSPQFQVFSLQKAAADGLMLLMRDIGRGYLALCSYNCKEAISILSQLPSHHYNTGWVLGQIGRAHFELAEYMQAERIFSEVRRIESYRVEGMEIYSTTLWHLQKDVALSALSKDLTDMDKNSPEAWCVAGNCFSLQREHDIAIKFFQRAIQVNPGFAYAYTLLGHEFVLTEELEKALACFRNAIRVNTRHYNAWYGLGMIYYKQEKFNLAEIHFKKALSINPQSSVLLCHIGVPGIHTQALSIPMDVRMLDGRSIGRVPYNTTPTPIIKLQGVYVLLPPPPAQGSLKDKTQCLCIDYRGLNDITVKNRIASAFEPLQWATIFSKLDMRNAYHLLNDILVFSHSAQEHMLHVRQVLQHLPENQIFMKVEKCEFHRSTIPFLGYNIAAGNVQMDPGKVPFTWSPAADRVFQDLKHRFTTAPILVHPDPSRQFVVEADASDVGVGAVLFQRSSLDLKLHPCAFFSHRLLLPSPQCYGEELRCGESTRLLGKLRLSLSTTACPSPSLISHIPGFVTGLPPSDGNTTILTVVDRFSKAAHFIPLPKLPSAKETAQLMVQHVFRIHGLLVDMVSNWGPQFSSRCCKAFCTLIGSSASLSSGFHPQSNGQSERANQDLETTLRCLFSTNPTTWSQQLVCVEYACNTLPCSATGLSPFECSLVPA
ncbi:cell division cycle protein 27 homolog [Salvelinus sp. IW2-2015]|uniref:cell division cycle protein 27 homolog n=1 Tax=Salvelinus sp. IW2-2015 TaxID=2691554 RepID=UPI0038D4BCD2